LGKGKRRWLVSHIILIVLGGAAIRKLEMKSHCSIKLDVGEPSSNFKICLNMHIKETPIGVEMF
jgi:hypothetical protein